MISIQQLNSLVHAGNIYDYQGMIGLIEEQFDSLQLISDTKIDVPKSFNFWHFSLSYIIGEDIDNGCVRSLNWAEILQRNKDKPQWVQDICKIGVDCFGDTNYQIYIGW